PQARPRPHARHPAFLDVLSGLVALPAQDNKENWMPSMRAASGKRIYAANFRLKEKRHIAADTDQEKTQKEHEAAESRKK
ncbi:hypothetical protein VSS93_31360, partial [Pseudomonas syringae pv. tagetis]